MDLDLKEYALRALDTAKEDLCRDGYLLPVAFIVTDKEVLDFNLSYEGEAQKTSVYCRLVEVAREKRGTAIITVNDAHCAKPSATVSLEGYFPGKLEVEGSPECIYVTVSGPSITTWSISAPYKRTATGIIFEKSTESFGDSLSLLEGWASGRQNAS